MRGPFLTIGIVATVVLAGIMYFAATHQGPDTPPPVSAGKYDPAVPLSCTDLDQRLPDLQFTSDLRLRMGATDGNQCEFRDESGKAGLTVRFEVYPSMAGVPGEQSARDMYEHLDVSRLPLATFIGDGEAASYYADANCDLTEFTMRDVNAIFRINYSDRRPGADDTACLARAKDATKAAFDTAQPR